MHLGGLDLMPIGVTYPRTGVLLTPGLIRILSDKSETYRIARELLW